MTASATVLSNDRDRETPRDGGERGNVLPRHCVTAMAQLHKSCRFGKLPPPSPSPPPYLLPPLPPPPSLPPTLGSAQIFPKRLNCRPGGLVHVPACGGMAALDLQRNQRPSVFFNLQLTVRSSPHHSTAQQTEKETKKESERRPTSLASCPRLWSDSQPNLPPAAHIPLGRLTLHVFMTHTHTHNNTGKASSHR